MDEHFRQRAKIQTMADSAMDTATSSLEYEATAAVSDQHQPQQIDLVPGRGGADTGGSSGGGGRGNATVMDAFGGDASSEEEDTFHDTTGSLRPGSFSLAAAETTSPSSSIEASPGHVSLSETHSSDYADPASLGSGGRSRLVPANQGPVSMPMMSGAGSGYGPPSLSQPPLSGQHSLPQPSGGGSDDVAASRGSAPSSHGSAAAAAGALVAETTPPAPRDGPVSPAPTLVTESYHGNSGVGGGGGGGGGLSSRSSSSVEGSTATSSRSASGRHQLSGRSYLPPSGGYPVQVAQDVEALDSYMCTHCQCLLRDPLQSMCGHRFCSSCYRRLLRQPSPVCPSPQCTEHRLMPSDFRDVHAARDINVMRVYCMYQGTGCQWEGTVEDLESHLAACGFAKDPCPNAGCMAMLLRTELVQHAQHDCLYRRIACDYCQQPITFGDLQVHFDERCPSLPVNCMYDCGSRISRHAIEDHLKRCKNAPASCKYAEYGCAFPKSARQDIVLHEEREAHTHLELMCRQVGSLKESLAQLVSIVKSLQQRSSPEVVQGECIAYCQAYSQEMAASGQAHAGAAAGRASGASEERLSTFEEMLRVQAQDIGKLHGDVQSYTRSTKAHDSESPSFAQTLNSLEYSVLKQSEGIADLSHRMDIMDAKETGGVLVWKITDLRRRVADARDKKTPSLYSAPFYTSSAGYRMCCRVYLDGDGIGRGTHISVFFVLMQGDFDNLLTWPFPFKVTLLLMNQDESVPQNDRVPIQESFRPGQNSTAFRKPTSQMNTGTGCPKFAPREVLNPNSVHVRDDCIFIKVAVSHVKDTYVPPDKAPSSGS